jgi:hypothetical protein
MTQGSQRSSRREGCAERFIRVCSTGVSGYTCGNAATVCLDSESRQGVDCCRCLYGSFPQQKARDPGGERPSGRYGGTLCWVDVGKDRNGKGAALARDVQQPGRSGARTLILGRWGHDGGFSGGHSRVGTSAQALDPGLPGRRRREVGRLRSPYGPRTLVGRIQAMDFIR